MNFHIFSAYNSEFRIDPRKKFGIVRIDFRKKFGIVLIFRMIPEKNLELSRILRIDPGKKLRSETTTLIWKILTDSEIIPS